MALGTGFTVARRTAALMLGVAALGVATLGAAALWPSAARAADQVIVQLDWVPRGNHAMFFVAKEKGYFTKNDIDVTTINKGTGSINTLRIVGTGGAQFGFADLPSLFVSRSQGVGVSALAAINQRSPMAMLAVKSKHTLTKPQDLKGLNMGVSAAGSTFVFTKAFLASNGMALEDMKQSTVNPPYESYLVLGRVDVVPGYVDAEVPELEEKTGGPGSLSILYGSDWGYKAYGSGLIVGDRLIAEKPDLVQRFTTAYMQAYADVVTNPKDGVAAIVKANPEFKGKEEVLLKQIEADMEHSFFSAATKEKGLGWITAEQWKETGETLQKQAVIPKEANITTGFDMTFLEKANALKK